MLIVRDYVHCKLHCDDKITAGITYSTMTWHTHLCTAFCSSCAAEDFHSFRMASATSSFVQILHLVDWILSEFVTLILYWIGMILWIGGALLRQCVKPLHGTKFSHVMLTVTEAVTDHITCDRLRSVRFYQCWCCPSHL